MSKFRIGVIGAGAIAQHCHIPGYVASKKCELTAIADPLKRCLTDVKKRGFLFQNTYSDYKEMLKKEELDVLSICTPNVYHREIAVAATKTVANILLEKPVAMTVPEARAIKRAVERNKTRLMVSFTHRFNNFNIKAREALKAGKIGKPYMIRIRFSHVGPAPGWAKTDWFYTPKLSGGGAMLDMAVHAFDLLNWYIGPVKTVQAIVATLRKKIKVDDNALTIVEFAKQKCLGYVEVGWTSPAGFCGVEIMGDKGVIIVDYGSGKVTMTVGVRKASGESTQKTTIITNQAGNAWHSEMKHFTGNLGSKGPFATCIDDGIAAQKIAVAAYQSHKTGKRVNIT